MRARWSMSPCSADGLEAVLLQRAVQRADVALAVAEHDGVLEVFLGADGAAQDIAFFGLVRGRGDEVLGNGRGGGGGLGHLDLHRIIEELGNKALNFRRHRRREEERLAARRDQFADALDVGDEAHVEHAVGFVDDEDLDAGHQQAAAFEMVEQAAGRCDEDVDAAREFRVLVAEGEAADEERDREFVVRAVAVEAFLDLGCEFAGRFEDERARHSGPCAALFEARQHRQREARRLAGAGLGDAENVAPRDDVRDCFRLDGRWRRVARRRDGGQDLGA